MLGGVSKECSTHQKMSRSGGLLSKQRYQLPPHPPTIDLVSPPIIQFSSQQFTYNQYSPPTPPIYEIEERRNLNYTSHNPNPKWMTNQRDLLFLRMVFIFIKLEPCEFIIEQFSSSFSSFFLFLLLSLLSLLLL